MKILIDVSTAEYTSTNKHLIDKLGSKYEVEKQYSGDTLVKFTIFLMINIKLILTQKYNIY